MRLDEMPSALMLQLPPPRSPWLCSLEAPGVLKASARTSTAGPGLPRLRGGMVDRLAEALGVTFTAESPTPPIPTGYRTHRDLDRLMRAHAAQLASLARHLLAEGSGAAPGSEVHPVRLGMPPFAPSPTGPQGRVASCTGLWATDFLEALVAAEPDARADLAARFLRW